IVNLLQQHNTRLLDVERTQDFISAEIATGIEDIRKRQHNIILEEQLKAHNHNQLETPTNGSKNRSLAIKATITTGAESSHTSPSHCQDKGDSSCNRHH
ncbi:hypothetical protein A2U01_0073032, partial [Trifolium medium]|nr:hypothetical protein [Trifolium medium]